MRSLTQRSLDALRRIERGDTSSCVFVYKFGFNNDVDTTEETIWDEGGIYNYIPSPTTLSFSSSSANDAAVGTGARTIRAEGLDENYDSLQEDITLNGQTEVNSLATFARIFRMYVLTAGSSEAAEGDIYAGTGVVTAGVPAEVYAKITQGNDQTLMATYTIPRARIGLLVAASVSTGGNANAIVNARTVVRSFGGVFRTGARFLINNRPLREDLMYPVVLDEKTDYEIRATGSANNIDVSATFQIMVMNA